MDEQEFRKAADAALDDLNQSLIDSNDDRFEVDMNNGAMTIDIEQPAARFVVSPNTPVKQIWLSALSKSFESLPGGGENEGSLRRIPIKFEAF